MPRRFARQHFQLCPRSYKWIRNMLLEITSNSIQVICAFVLAVAAAIGMLTWHFSRSRSVLERWAEQHSFEIVHSEYRFFFQGPFFWTTFRGRTVYRVKVRDGSGELHSGWVRCGSFFLGLLSDKAEVRWDAARLEVNRKA
jgi:hypothetical protein